MTPLLTTEGGQAEHKLTRPPPNARAIPTLGQWLDRCARGVAEANVKWGELFNYRERSRLFPKVAPSTHTSEGLLLNIQHLLFLMWKQIMLQTQRCEVQSTRNPFLMLCVSSTPHFDR